MSIPVHTLSYVGARECANVCVCVCLHGST